ncbi:hypothetical protein CBR_g5595 [Chara braunii]|uniref:HAT C-terminal dimerisation domain-containing protein n=1 Tax=Chara braunii TaxID=69332 RepID=A0A388JRH2_CHABU|nr:hypothetical protein CBR_g5595 [Chara braunii]|eukprot:GBG60419.1 hypothetical protein CBR_g5595 [Chara braunii]
MLLSPIHVMARLLDPRLRDISVFSNEELIAQFDNVVDRLVAKKGTQKFNDCTDQLYDFQFAIGVFGSVGALRSAEKDNAVLWWKAHGGGHPEIKKLAIKVLSIWTTSSPAERNWSTWTLVQMKTRNQLKHKRTEKLVYSLWNLRLKSRGEDGPTVKGGWFGLQRDWEDEDLDGEAAGEVDVDDGVVVGLEAAGSERGSTTIEEEQQVDEQLDEEQQEEEQPEDQQQRGDEEQHEQQEDKQLVEPQPEDQQQREQHDQQKEQQMDDHVEEQREQEGEQQGEQLHAFYGPKRPSQLLGRLGAAPSGLWDPLAYRPSRGGRAGP